MEFNIGRSYKDREGTVRQVIEVVMSRAYPILAINVLTREKATYDLAGHFLLGNQGPHLYDLIEEVSGQSIPVDAHPELDATDYFRKILWDGRPQ
jgi:hypothetical protein